MQAALGIYSQLNKLKTSLKITSATVTDTLKEFQVKVITPRHRDLRQWSCHHSDLIQIENKAAKSGQILKRQTGFQKDRFFKK